MPGFGVEREEDLDFRGVDRHPPGGGELEWTGGAELVLGGGPHARGGQFFSPSVLTGVIASGGCLRRSSAEVPVHGMALR